MLVALPGKIWSRLYFFQAFYTHARICIHAHLYACMQALVLPLRKLAEHKKELAHFKLVASCESPNDCKALYWGEKNHIQTQHGVLKQRSTRTSKGALRRNSGLPPPPALSRPHFPFNLRWEDTKTNSAGPLGSTVCLDGCIYLVLTLSFTRFF